MVTGLDRVLIANRGEIAVRICHTLQAMGITAIAVYSDADADAPHVRAADEAVRLGPAPAAHSYLDVGRVVAAARATGADAVHPGYGFLSENPALARACAEGGVVFVGPPPAAMEAMADKARARDLMRRAGVPVVPGTGAIDGDDASLVAAAEAIGLPLMVKPVAGGGGKGMAVVHTRDDLPDAVRAARRQAAHAFGDDRVLLERFVPRPRHVEVQILADDHGHTLHLGERECSLQRRHQKIVEEAPSPLLDRHMRPRIGASAVAAAEACGYRGAGTVEFIVSAAHPDIFFFLEMNTRLQVEHPVTEMVTGLDLVEWQIRVAAGEVLPWRQQDLGASGHAVEARVYAEDPARDFLPTGGTVLAYGEPAGAGVRVDSGIAVGTTVSGLYDPLLAKVIAHGTDRAAALRRLDRALGDLTVLGVRTNVGFLRGLLRSAEVRAGEMDTGLVERDLGDLLPDPPSDGVFAAAALGHLAGLEQQPRRSLFDRQGGWRIGEHAWTPLHLVSADRAATVRVRGTGADAHVAVGDAPPRPARAVRSGSSLTVTCDDRTRRYALAEADGVIWLGIDGDAWAVRHEERLHAVPQADAVSGPVRAPMPGTVTAVHVRNGDTVVAGQALLVIEAMKMEHLLVAPAGGMIERLSVREGDQVELERALLEVVPVQ